MKYSSQLPVASLVESTPHLRKSIPPYCIILQYCTVTRLIELFLPSARLQSKEGTKSPRLGTDPHSYGTRSSCEMTGYLWFAKA
jgi:hypothetical protein